MNKLVFSFLIFVTLFTVTGCSEKFEIAAPYKDITVVYGFLDARDTAHYIRIQKAFIDQDRNALSMAKTPDSNFYNNLNVRINRLSASDTGRYIDSIHLTRVDLNLEGYPKQPGAFFDAPNYAYKFKGALNPNYFYRLIITNLTTGAVDSSIAPIIDDITPGNFIIDVLDDPNADNEMDFASTLSNQNYEFDVYYRPVANFNYYGYGSPAYTAYTIVRFNYVDSNFVTLQKTNRSYDFVLGYADMRSGVTANYKTPNLNFYSAIRLGIGNAPENTVRLMDRAEILCYLTTVDYHNYQAATATQGVGLTGNEIHPVYTNIKGANALGLYTSRGFHSGFITLNSNTIQSLKTSSLVANVRIVGTVYH